MLRRPVGHVAPQRKYLLALALLILPWLPIADAQQQHQRVRSPPQDDQHAAANLAATPVADQEIIETPLIDQRRKTTVTRQFDDDEIRQRAFARANNHNNHNNPDNFVSDDVRAHALALDLSVRAQPPSQHRGPSPGAGLSQHVARSLEDWEVEDFVLLATVDGDLYASDRKTGQERWRFKADHPMVETTHFGVNRSVLDEDYRPIDHYIWVVEPTRDGELYLWRPNEAVTGLAKMALTMKKLVEELSPHRDTENGVVYTGDKKTTMVTLNAATGTILKQFGSSGSYVNKADSESCFKPNALSDGEEECGEDSTITLGRTEYTVSIQLFDGRPIASLKYSEWGPNTQDNDLIEQNRLTKDNRYITGQHDGKVYGFEYGRFSEQRPEFTKTLASPVARVFDVLHRWGATAPVDPELIVLPQPPLPASDADSLRRRSESVFINRTEEGSWYALSGSRYPLILSAPAAPIHRLDWWRIKDAWDLLPEAQKSKALVGIHQLPDVFVTPENDSGEESSRLGIGGPPTDAGDPKLPTPPHPEPHPEQPKILDAAKKVSGLVVTRVFDLISNPAAIVLFCVSLYYLYRDRLASSARKSWGKGDAFASRIEVNPTISRSPSPPPESRVTVEPVEPKAEKVAIPEAIPADVVPAEVPGEESSTESQPSTQESPPSVPFSDPPEPTTPPTSEGTDAAGAAESKKKKGHRGRRGGVKHRKGSNKDKRENSQSRDDDPPQETVEEVVNKAKNLVREPMLEPDIITVSGAADEVSGSTLKMGSLEVNEAEQLGTGSNGTIVFAGKWDGRNVAVKRMLVQFNEIASQETRLLRESDDHPNGTSDPSRFLFDCANEHSDPLLCPARARRVPVHCTGALSSFARRRDPKAQRFSGAGPGWRA